MNIQACERLLAEKAVLQRLRGELPPDHVLERSGFAQRLEMLEEKLAEATDGASKSEMGRVKPR